MTITFAFNNRSLDIYGLLGMGFKFQGFKISRNWIKFITPEIPIERETQSSNLEPLHYIHEKLVQLCLYSIEYFITDV